MAFRPVRLVTYLWRLTAARLAGALALLMGVYVLIDSIESASYARLHVAAVIAAYPFKLPLVTAHIAPLACTLAVLLTFGTLHRRGEWDAAAAAGIGPFPLLAGLAAIPFAVAVAAVPLVHALAPLALARFEARTSAPHEGGGGTWWTREGRTLVRWGDSGGDPTALLAIERGRDGGAMSWRGQCGRGKVCAWRRGGRWIEGAPEPAPKSPRGPARAPQPSAYGFVGASLASPALGALARDLEAHGQSAHALRAELALRTAVAAGAAIVPALALALAFACGLRRDTRLVGLGLVTAATYWAALAVAWNGAVLGAISPTWVSAGVPAAFAAATIVLSVRIVTGSSRAR
jgi:lipopolysaccharide export LptBFGC system permease protein LptF